MVRQGRRRSRGKVFTDRGLQKLQLKMRAYENRENSGKKLTLEKLSEITGLAHNTVFKLLKRKKGVDKRTLAKFFLVFDLELNFDDYTSSGLPLNHSCKRNLEWANLINTFEVSKFYGRITELTTLKQWLVEDCCRLVTVYGMRGIGKTALSVKLVKEIEGNFDYVFWKSLRQSPSPEVLTSDLIQFLFNKHEPETDSLNGAKKSYAELFNYLRLHRCLIVLDDVETAMQVGIYSGLYHQIYKKFGQLIRNMAEVSHQSCFLLVSRELPKEASFFDGSNLPVKTMELNSLPKLEGLRFIQKYNCLISASLQKKIFDCSFGNPLVLINLLKKVAVNDNNQTHALLNKNEYLYSDILDILEQDYQKLSILENKICYRLASFTTAILRSQLLEDTVISASPIEIMIALESLRKRSLIIIKKDRVWLNPFLYKYIASKRICNKV